MTWPSNSLALPYRRAGLPCRWAMYSIYIYIHGWKPLYIIIYILRYFERYVWPNSYRILKPFECSTCMTLTIDHQGVHHDIQEPINIYIYVEPNREETCCFNLCESTCRNCVSMYSHYNMHTLLKWRITKTISYWHCSKYLRARSNMIRETYIPSRCRFQRSNIVSPQLRAFQGYNENTSNDNKDCCSRSINSLRNCWLFIKKMWCFIKKTYPCPPCNRDSHGDKCPKIPSSCFFPDRKR